MLPSSMNISLDLFFSKFMMPEICLLMTVKVFFGQRTSLFAADSYIFFAFVFHRKNGR